ncbi:hypothetical protein Misp06_03266 [Microbulbifer sp. NBRC 101763]
MDWDSICKVQVTGGKNPSFTNFQTYKNVRRGWEIERPYQICYRRNEEPSQCNSKMTLWRCKRYVESDDPKSNTFPLF